MIEYYKTQVHEVYYLQRVILERFFKESSIRVAILETTVTAGKRVVKELKGKGKLT